MATPPPPSMAPCSVRPRTMRFGPDNKTTRRGCVAGVGLPVSHIWHARASTPAFSGPAGHRLRSAEQADPLLPRKILRRVPGALRVWLVHACVRIQGCRASPDVVAPAQACARGTGEGGDPKGDQGATQPAKVSHKILRRREVRRVGEHASE
eukprot:6189850-Pleurochrysis_carterae.AAC.1